MDGVYCGVPTSYVSLLLRLAVLLLVRSSRSFLKGSSSRVELFTPHIGRHPTPELGAKCATSQKIHRLPTIAFN
jgi:hypothetical protein